MKFRGRKLIAAMALALVSPCQATDVPFAEEIRQFGIEDQIYPPSGCETLFVGSSSFRFWTRMQQDFAKERILRRGFGGASISDINFHFDAIVGRYRPKYIVFYAGENDVNGGKPIENILADFRIFLERKNAVLGKIPVLFLSVKPSIARTSDSVLQAELNLRVAQLAEKRNDLVYVDIVRPMLRDGKPRPELFISDKLHMNEKGYAIWTGRISHALAKTGLRKGDRCT